MLLLYVPIVCSVRAHSARAACALTRIVVYLQRHRDGMRSLREDEYMAEQVCRRPGLQRALQIKVRPRHGSGR